MAQRLRLQRRMGIVLQCVWSYHSHSSMVFFQLFLLFSMRFILRFARIICLSRRISSMQFKKKTKKNMYSVLLILLFRKWHFVRLTNQCALSIHIKISSTIWPPKRFRLRDCVDCLWSRSHFRYKYIYLCAVCVCVCVDFVGIFMIWSKFCLFVCLFI